MRRDLANPTTINSELFLTGSTVGKLWSLSGFQPRSRLLPFLDVFSWHCTLFYDDQCKIMSKNKNELYIIQSDFTSQKIKI